MSELDFKALNTAFYHVKSNLIDEFQGSLRSPLVRSSRVGSRPYPIPPTAIKDVFLVENLLWLASATRSAQSTVVPRATNIRSFLEQELEAAYDLITQVPEFPLLVEQIADAVESRQFNDVLEGFYTQIVASLPGDLKMQRNVTTAILFYAIAIDAGLLNRRLQHEMEALAEQRDFQPPCDVKGLSFYLPAPRGASGLPAIYQRSLAHHHLCPGPRRRPTEHRRCDEHPSRSAGRHRRRPVNGQDQPQPIQPVPAADRD